MEISDEWVMLAYDNDFVIMEETREEIVQKTTVLIKDSISMDLCVKDEKKLMENNIIPQLFSANSDV